MSLLHVFFDQQTLYIYTGFVLTQKTCVFDTRIKSNTHRNFLWGSLGTHMQLEMLDLFGNFDKKQCQMPSSQQIKLHSYGPFITDSHTNLKPRHNMDIG